MIFFKPSYKKNAVFYHCIYKAVPLSLCPPSNQNNYMGGISQDVKRQKIWDFYPLFFGVS